MFLDSGDGLVFKGTPGNYYHVETKSFHLSRQAARALVAQAVAAYKDKREHKQPPREVFIHGKVSFLREEWEGFKEAVGPETNIVGVKIRDGASLKLFRKTDTPVLRGMAYVRHEKSALLWTRGGRLDWRPTLVWKFQIRSR